jgi:Dolichyl-phosphate-mannose-protein mannosyltransferase
MSKVRATFVLLLLLGAALRATNLGSRSFWRDEAWVVQAVLDLSYAELLTQTDAPLPPLFAWLVKACTTLPAAQEIALRLPPLAFGVAVLPLTFLALRRLRLPPAAALCGMALVACSLSLVLWSRECKQYSAEAALFLAACVCDAALRRAKNARGAALALIGVCGSAPWLGYGTSIAIGAALATALCLDRRTHATARMIALAVLGISTVGVLLACAKGQAADPSLIAFTQRWYISLGEAGSWRMPLFGAICGTALFLVPVSYNVDILPFAIVCIALLALALIGLLRWPRATRACAAAWVAAPWLAFFAAALMHKYPFGAPRMMVILAAPTLMAAALGGIVLARMFQSVLTERRWRRAAAWTPIGLALLLSPIAAMASLHNAFWADEDWPGVLRELAAKRGPGESVFVAVHAVPATRLYAPRLEEPVEWAAVAGGVVPRAGHDYAAQMRAFLRRAGRRWWMLTTSDSRDEIGSDFVSQLRDAGWDVQQRAACGSAWSMNRAVLLEVAR